METSHEELHARAHQVAVAAVDRDVQGDLVERPVVGALDALALLVAEHHRLVAAVVGRGRVVDVEAAVAAVPAEHDVERGMVDGADPATCRRACPCAAFGFGAAAVLVVAEDVRQDRLRGGRLPVGRLRQRAGHCDRSRPYFGCVEHQPVRFGRQPTAYVELAAVGRRVDATHGQCTITGAAAGELEGVATARAAWTRSAALRRPSSTGCSRTHSRSGQPGQCRRAPRPRGPRW